MEALPLGNIHQHPAAACLLVVAQHCFFTLHNIFPCMDD
jgi:hypothetical protein